MLAPLGEYYNYSGCGNTLNCNHPTVRPPEHVSSLLLHVMCWASVLRVLSVMCVLSMPCMYIASPI